MNNILLAQQDSDERDQIVDTLEQNGFEVALAECCDQVLNQIRSKILDMVILDLYLEEGGQFSVCNSIHELATIPIMMITAQGDDQEIMNGLEAGAADFITRPVRMPEMIARVRTILKRTSSPLSLPGWMLQYGDLLLDLRSRRVLRNGQPLPLTRTEMRLLSFFMRHVGETLSKVDLMRNVWNYQDVPGDYNLVESAIKRLRNTVEDDPKNPSYIHTVWGEGYRFGK